MIWGRFKAKPLPCEQESLRARVSASPPAEASSPGAWRSGSGRLVSCQDLSSRNLLPDTFLPTGNGRQRLPSGPRCRTGSACCVASGNALCLSEPPQQAIPQGLVGTWRSECFLTENSPPSLQSSPEGRPWGAESTCVGGWAGFVLKGPGALGSGRKLKLPGVRQRLPGHPASLTTP